MEPNSQSATRPHPGRFVRQEQDEYVCSACRKRWEIHDPEPPPCEPVKVNRKAEQRARDRG